MQGPISLMFTYEPIPSGSTYTSSHIVLKLTLYDNLNDILSIPEATP